MSVIPGMVWSKAMLGKTAVIFLHDLTGLSQSPDMWVLVLALTRCVEVGESFGLPRFHFASKWAGGPYLREDPARSKIWKFFAADI